MAVTFHNLDTDFRFPGKRAVSSWIKETIVSEGFKTGDISIVFCSREEHLRINSRFLDHDYATDVITFDNSVDQGVISGDIFIDHLTVSENAETFDTSPAQEMHRVIIHGILHLCGYGDKTPEQQKIMRSREDLYLDSFDKK